MMNEENQNDDQILEDAGKEVEKEEENQEMMTRFSVYLFHTMDGYVECGS